LGRTPPFSLLLNYSNNFIIGVNNRLWECFIFGLMMASV
jgi:hypothetical protein